MSVPRMALPVRIERVRFLAALALALALAMLLACGSARAAYPGRNGQLAFETFDSQDSEGGPPFTESDVIESRQLRIAEEPFGRLASLIDRQDVRVLERRLQHGFAAKALAEVGVVAEVAGQKLQRNNPLERELGRPVDRPHATRGDELLDPVAGEHGARVEHHGAPGQPPREAHSAGTRAG